MPIYEYAVMQPDGRLGNTFEVLQGINDPPLTVHPETGEPVERILSMASFSGGAPSKIGAKADISSGNLERLGFTQYKKSGDGQYQKSFGAGPDMISRDDVE